MPQPPCFHRLVNAAGRNSSSTSCSTLAAAARALPGVVAFRESSRRNNSPMMMMPVRHMHSSGPPSGDHDDHDDHDDESGTITHRIPEPPGRHYDSISKEEPKWAKFPDGSRFWKNKNGRSQRPIFVAATRQHVGVSTNKQFDSNRLV